MIQMIFTDIKMIINEVKKMNKTVILKRKVFIILMIVWMAAIFAFSSRSGDESSEDSYFVGRMVGELVIPGFNDWSAQRQQEFAESIDHPVRKTAHATEYAFLGLLCAGAYIRPGTSIKKGIFIPLAITAVYAGTDEFHQLFIPGRSGQFSDVLLDSAGACTGLLILAAVRCIRRKNKKNRVQSNFSVDN